MAKQEPQLHELLAAEPGLKKTAFALIAEAINTFTKKTGYFFGQIRRFQRIDDEGQDFPPEDKTINADVTEKLLFVSNAFENFLDALIQKEETNTTTKATLQLSGYDIELSAQSLLSLETALNGLKPMITSIPTLPTGITWHKDEGVPGQWVSSTVDTIKMKKVQKPLVLAPPTKEHPAQVQLVTEDVPIGTWSTKQISTAMTPEQKSRIIARADDLIRKVKQARMRANTAKVVKIKIGNQILKYILGS